VASSDRKKKNEKRIVPLPPTGVYLFKNDLKKKDSDPKTQKKDDIKAKTKRSTAGIGSSTHGKFNLSPNGSKCIFNSIFF
jgi:hypothetical protein